MFKASEGSDKMSKEEIQEDYEDLLEELDYSQDFLEAVRKKDEKLADKIEELLYSYAFNNFDGGRKNRW